jgi:putative ABC transport system permease protein
MAALFPDFRYALRQLGKSPGFTSTALMTIAFGIGAVTAAFSVVNSVLLQPFAFRDPGQIVVWHESIREIEPVAPILPDNYRHYLNLKTHANSIQDAAILQTAEFSVSTGVHHPHVTEGLAVSPNFFSVFGVTLPLD